MSSIKEVANLAGVSVATVSRVLNNPEKVSEHTKQLVLETTKSLGYTPNLIGKHLRCNETKLIIVMLSSLANSFCSKVIHSIEQTAMMHGYKIMIYATNESHESEINCLNFVKNKLADGLIILSSSLSAEELNNAINNIPVVLCNEYVISSNVPYVAIDNKKAGYEAVTRLIKNGRKQIVFLSVKNNLTSTRLRFEGYLQALADNNIEYNPSLVIQGNYGYRNSIAVVNEFIKTDTYFDGLFAISDRMAAGAINAIQSNGFHVPDEIEVIGFDNTDITYTFTPTISTIAQPTKELGKSSFELLLSLIRKEKCKNIILPHKIVERNSTRRL